MWKGVGLYIFGGDCVYCFVDIQLIQNVGLRGQTLKFIAASFTIAKTWKQPKCPVLDEWTKKMWYDDAME